MQAGDNYFFAIQIFRPVAVNNAGSVPFLFARSIIPVPGLQLCARIFLIVCRMFFQQGRIFYEKNYSTGLSGAVAAGAVPG